MRHEFTDYRYTIPEVETWVREYTKDPLEQEAHKVGLEVSQRIKIEDKTVPVETDGKDI